MGGKKKTLSIKIIGDLSMNVKEIFIVGKYNKQMSLCGDKEKIYVCDNFVINLENDVGINAIAHLDKEGYYFNILKVVNKDRWYKNSKYFTKYITLVRDSIFEYYKKNGKEILV